MSSLAIKVENLSKQYRIGTREFYKTFRESIVDSVTAPFRRLKSIGKPVPKKEILWALQDISFEIEEGEVLGIIGQNGAGKTTLLKILSRITKPTQGRVTLKGRVASLLEVGTGFHPELTGKENIYLNGAILGMDRYEISKKFDEIATFAEMERFLDTPVKRYSSGMYMRLAFAVAAHLESEILLMDEVLAVGDATFQKKCLNKMGKVAKEGRTVLFVSHNMAAILNLCSRSIMLDNGRIVKSGDTDEVVRYYLMEGIDSTGKVTISRDDGGLTNKFFFRSVSTLTTDGHPTNVISLTEGMIVEIEYEVCELIQGANVAFMLWNSSGICVFASTDVDHDPSSIEKLRKPGCYIARCHISRHYLRPGRYFIGLSSSIPRVLMLASLPHSIAFDVLDNGSVEIKISEGRPGIISPILNWSTERIRGT